MKNKPSGNGSQRQLRCAIYTRKSTEEGLDQDFNSLDAQREACEAYIASQRHEGWVMLPEPYDDGGYSGGSMERPGLKRLLANVEAGRIDVVVVYKVDRLTRALADFAKIVEIFDAKGASFVSVTQAFNTTTSMGRLTLNVLLSFAQFEREVTAERIRDKIAASKKRGMWMGGVVPLGYDVADRKLVVKADEAETVRLIFQRYRDLGSVRALKAELDRNGIVSKRRIGSGGRVSGGKSFSRGALYAVLQNPIYCGEIAHKGERYPGLHEAIVDNELWTEIQQRLADNRRNGVRRPGTARESFLTGLLHDAGGNPMIASHAVKRLAGGGAAAHKRYRYYVAQANNNTDEPLLRLPAARVEDAVLVMLSDALQDQIVLVPALRPHLRSTTALESTLERIRNATQALSNEETLGLEPAGPNSQTALLHALVSRIDHGIDHLRLHIKIAALLDRYGPEQKIDPDRGGETCDSIDDVIVFERPFSGPVNGRPAQLILGAAPDRPRRDAALIALVANARRWSGMLLSGNATSVLEITDREGLGKGVISRTLPLAFLAPDIAGAILDGRQPDGLTAGGFYRLADLPRDWDAQRRLLGFIRAA
jgi:DNA invertase Pin-like site-specific DNA recombinase